MSMYECPYDAIDEFNAHDRARQKWLDSRPKCSHCGEPIADDEYYDFGDGEKICENCKSDYVEKNFLVKIDD